MARKERHERAREALERVQLGKFVGRKPAQLSGGQRQRVALARALVVQPKALLLDEPLGALDLKLRQQMQVELKELQRSLGITFIFVTHDQEEALTMSDRIGVFNNGSLEQIGTAHEIYERPGGAFVANFVGSPTFRRRPRPETLRPRGAGLHPPGTAAPVLGGAPEPRDGVTSRPGTVTSLVYVGHATRCGYSSTTVPPSSCWRRKHCPAATPNCWTAASRSAGMTTPPSGCRPAAPDASLRAEPASDSPTTKGKDHGIKE